MCQQLMGPDTHKDIRGFDTDNKIIIVHLLYHLHLVQCAFHKSLRRHFPIFFNELFLQRTAVYSYPNRDIPLFCHIHHSFHLIPATDIAGIDANLVRTVFHGRQCHLIIKMNIRHKRNGNLLFDLFHSHSRFLCRYGAADDLTPCRLQPVNLLHSGLHILCPRIGHGLYQYRISASDHSIPDRNYFCMFTMHFIFLSLLLSGQIF